LPYLLQNCKIMAVQVTLSPLEASAWESGPAFESVPIETQQEHARALFEVRVLSAGESAPKAKETAEQMAQAWARATRKIEEATRFEISVAP